MVAHVLALRIAMIGGAFRGTRAVVRHAVLTLLLTAASVVVVCIAVLSLRDDPTERALALLVIVGALTLAGCGILPAIGAVADPAAPSLFAELGLSPRALAVALLLAAPFGVHAFGLIAISVCIAVTATAHGVPVGWAAAGAALAVITGLLMALGGAAVRGAAPARGQFRAIALAVPLIVAALSLLVAAALVLWPAAADLFASGVATVLAFTPWGAAWSIAVGVATPVSWIIAGLTLVALIVAWFAVVARETRGVREPRQVEPDRLGWFRIFPGDAAGVIAARSMLYWTSDARYLVNVIAVPVAAVLVMVPLVVVGVPIEGAVLIVPPVIALLAGWLPHNDVAFDSTALWIHFSAGVRGLADRLGRLAPSAIMGIPLLVIAIAVSVTVSGRPDMLGPLIGVSASLLLSGWGMSSLTSAIAPYPASRPGEGIFEQPQRTIGATTQGVALVGALALSAPALWWAWRAFQEQGSPTLALWGGLGIGVAVAAAGIALGSWAYTRRAGRLMEFATAN